MTTRDRAIVLLNLLLETDTIVSWEWADYEDGMVGITYHPREAAFIVSMAMVTDYFLGQRVFEEFALEHAPV
jgi:hypothetical protein